MAFGTRVRLVAIVADGMCLGHCPNRFRLWLNVVAIAAILFLMAVDARKSESIDMFLMMEGHHRAVRIGSRVELCCWLQQYGMRPSHDIGRIGFRDNCPRRSNRKVTDLAPRIMAPLAMAREALPMIRPLQAGLTKVDIGSL